MNCSHIEKRLLSKSLRDIIRNIRLEKAKLSGKILRSKRIQSKMRLLGSNMDNRNNKTTLVLAHKNSETMVWLKI